MKVLILRRPQKFEAEAIDDEKAHFGELTKLPVILRSKWTHQVDGQRIAVDKGLRIFSHRG